jgi:hypothetical protein
LPVVVDIGAPKRCRSLQFGLTTAHCDVQAASSPDAGQAFPLAAMTATGQIA